MNGSQLKKSHVLVMFRAVGICQKMRKPKSSRLSLQTKLNHAEEARDAYREALEDIADILEDVGILEPQDPENVGESDLPELEPEIIPGTAEEVE
jgi:hypothetical protein